MILECTPLSIIKWNFWIGTDNMILCLTGFVLLASLKAMKSKNNSSLLDPRRVGAKLSGSQTYTVISRKVTASIAKIFVLFRFLMLIRVQVAGATALQNIMMIIFNSIFCKSSLPVTIHFHIVHCLDFSVYHSNQMESVWKFLFDLLSSWPSRWRRRPQDRVDSGCRTA